MTRLYLIDATGLHHLLWHAGATDESGNEPDLQQRITSWWTEFRDKLNPTHVVACLDGKGSFRQKIDGGYKIARRAKAPDEAKLAALRSIDGIWRSLGVAEARADEFEGDDICATLSARFASDDVQVYIISTDKDLCSLVGQFEGGSAWLWDPKINKAGEHTLLDAAGVEAKHGIPPHRMTELLAIAGDASDSITGIAGVGKDSAKVAIRQTKSAAEIFRKAANGQLTGIRKDIVAKIANGRDDFEHALKLVSLRFDAPIELDLDQCAVKREGVAA